MCQMQEIRYVHHMQHSQYPDVLGCGCVCDGTWKKTTRARGNVIPVAKDPPWHPRPRGDRPVCRRPVVRPRRCSSRNSRIWPRAKGSYGLSVPYENRRYSRTYAVTTLDGIEAEAAKVVPLRGEF